MNIKSFFVIIGLIFCICLSANAQPGSGALTLDVYHMYVAGDIEIFDQRAKELEYNAFITEDWVQADLISENNQIVSKYLLKYDPYVQKLYLKEGADILAIPPTYIKGFILKTEEKNRNFEKFNIKGKAFEFLELIQKGEISLYKRYETSLLKANYNQLLDTGNFNDKVVIEEKYFLLKNGKFELIPTKNKKAKSFFIKKYSGSKNFIKKYKLNLQKEADLIKILNYLNRR